MPFTVTMPKLSPTMEEGTIAEWCIQEGSHVAAGELLIKVATDKATVEHSVIDPGYLRKILVGNGKSARVNQPIAIFSETLEENIEGYIPEGEVVEEQKIEIAAPLLQTQAAEVVRGGGFEQPFFTPEPPLEGYFLQREGKRVHGRLLASPLAKKMAREKGIDLSTIKGSGPGGRIVSRDLESGRGEALVRFHSDEEPVVDPGSYEEESMTPMRKMIGRRLQEAKTFIPHFYVTQEIDASPMVQIKEQLKEGGIKITINDLIIRAVALALKQHPKINSGMDTKTGNLIRFKTIDIAVAVGLPDGLITPIIRHADYKHLEEISSELRGLAQRARLGKLGKEEYMGGSFTISNLGMFGVRDFIAILNPPQAAILAVGGIQERPVIKQGVVVPGKVLSVTLSADHRVVDGVDVAKFLQTIELFLINPALLIG